MLAKDDMMGVLLDACPSFAPQWQAFIDDWRDEADLPLYIALGDLARHLVGLLERDERSEFPAVFRAVERLHCKGDEYVREAATVGLLEDLQNLEFHSTTTPEQFRGMLGTLSTQCWDELAASWERFFELQAREGRE